MLTSYDVERPVVSIITVSYNAVSTIETTIRSVIRQEYPEIEYIVVDGGSTDGTVDVIRSYEGDIDSWLSESDEGIGDAMNKGLGQARGDYVLFLNADDYLTGPAAIKEIVPSLRDEIVSGPIYKVDKSGRTRVMPARGFGWWMNFKTGLHHQATLCRTSTLIGLGGFNSNYKIAVDYDLFLRAYRASVNIGLFKHPFSIMGYGGISMANDAETLSKRLREERSIHRNNCPNRAMACIYFVYWHTYRPYRMVKGQLRDRWG